MGKKVQQKNPAYNAYLDRIATLTQQLKACASKEELDSILNEYDEMNGNNLLQQPEGLTDGQKLNGLNMAGRLNLLIEAKKTEFPAPVSVDELGEASEVVKAAETVDVVTTPETAVEVTTPETTEVVTVAETVEVVTTPKTVEVVTAPETAEVVTTPETAEVVTTPETAEVVTTPETAKVVTTPETAKVVTAPETAKVVTAPETAKVVTTPETAEVTTPKTVGGKSVAKASELNSVEQRTRQLVPVFDRLKAIDELHQNLLKRSTESNSPQDKENYKKASASALQIHADVLALSQKYILDGDLAHYKNNSAHIFKEGKDIQELNKHRGFNKNILLNVALCIAGLGILYAAACLARGGFFSVDTRSKKVVDEVSATVTAAIAAPAA